MVTGSGVVDDSRRSRQEEKPKVANYGLFLGGGNMPPRPTMERAKTADPRALGDKALHSDQTSQNAVK